MNVQQDVRSDAETLTSKITAIPRAPSFTPAAPERRKRWWRSPKLRYGIIVLLFFGVLGAIGGAAYTHTGAFATMHFSAQLQGDHAGNDVDNTACKALEAVPDSVTLLQSPFTEPITTPKGVACNIEGTDRTIVSLTLEHGTKSAMQSEFDANVSKFKLNARENYGCSSNVRSWPKRHYSGALKNHFACTLAKTAPNMTGQEYAFLTADGRTFGTLEVTSFDYSRSVYQSWPILKSLVSRPLQR